jgi:hypothetical protein
MQSNLKARLQSYKADARHNAKQAEEAHAQGKNETWIESYYPLTWQAVRAKARRIATHWGFPSSVWNPPYRPKGKSYDSRWCENIHKSGLAVQFENATKEVNDHTIGYYVDSFQDETIHGIVLRLPARRGFLAAVSDECNPDAARVQTGLIWDCPRDAARDADRMAESDAEEQRAHNDAWKAGNNWSELGQEIKDAREAIRALIKDARKVCSSLSIAPRVLDVIRADIKAKRREIRRAFEKRRELVDSVWSSYADSFNDGAEEIVITK